MLAENREVYAEAASSLYYQNSDRTIREMCEAREEAIRHEERMKRQLEEAREEAARREAELEAEVQQLRAQLQALQSAQS